MELGIKKISKENPNFASYKKTMKTWDEPLTATVKESFHAIYLGDIFLAAGITEFDKETQHANITILNGSNTKYEFVQEEATKMLTNLFTSENDNIDVCVKCLRAK